MKVPLVEPRSLITAPVSLRMIWQCEPETDASLMVKSLEAPRPSKFVPGLSWISQAFGCPGLTTSLFIAKQSSYCRKSWELFMPSLGELSMKKFSCAHSHKENRTQRLDKLKRI